MQAHFLIFIKGAEMAINKNKTKKLVEDIEGLFEELTKALPDDAKELIRKLVIGPALDELRTLVDESRPPVFLLLGRSGHGKSSLINALAGKHVAEVSDVKPGSPHSIAYEIIYQERYAAWTVVDTRGFFDTTRPDGALLDNAVDQLKQDVLKYKPDVLFHVITATELRTLSHDFVAYQEVVATIEQATGAKIPTIIVITKPDILGNPREWPPENNPQKASTIKEAINYLSQDILKVSGIQNIDLNSTIKGVCLNDNVYIGVIPVCSREGDLWNVETLSQFIGDHLPKAAILDFVQAQKINAQLKKVSSAIIKRFASIAATVGAIPIPIADIIILTPLQLLMIAIIGGLSCRELSKETAYEYLAAGGVNVAGAFGVRYIAQELVKLIPGGSLISAGIAGAATYGLGKAAEAYFFDKEIKKPDDFKGEWKS
jgi:uncharacterized protein (DUF697 family)/GTPase Era involved in 16S rRNA processing